MSRSMENRDFRITFPPVDSTSPPTLDPNEPPPRSGQKCGNCNAFAMMANPVLGQQPVCQALPVQPIYLGMQRTSTINPRTNQPDQYPLIMGTQAPTDPDNGWCRCWEWAGPGGDA